MKLVVGLGNPKDEHKNNRHNAGFIVLDAFAAQKGLLWSSNKKLLSQECRETNEDLILLKPQTFMNNSGEAVKRALSYYGIDSENLVVVHDDVDLEPLQFRVSYNASSGGHHGVQDIIDKLGTQKFKRIRVGIGRPKTLIQGQQKPLYKVEDYVLQDFSPQDLDYIRKVGIEYLLSSLKG